MLKDVVYPGVVFNQSYKIDEEGNVYSPYRGWKKLSPAKIKKGYLRVNLRTTTGSHFFMLHRLVLCAFCPVENSLCLQVNHIDGVKTNNRLSNLEWCTQKENMEHSVKMGLRSHMPHGEHASCNILTEKQVIEICEMLVSPTRESYAKIGAKYGVSKYAIHDIKRKKSWPWLTKNYNFEEGSTTSA